MPGSFVSDVSKIGDVSSPGGAWYVRVSSVVLFQRLAQNHWGSLLLALNDLSLGFGKGTFGQPPGKIVF